MKNSGSKGNECVRVFLNEKMPFNMKLCIFDMGIVIVLI